MLPSLMDRPPGVYTSVSVELKLRFAVGMSETVGAGSKEGTSSKRRRGAAACRSINGETEDRFVSAVA